MRVSDKIYIDLDQDIFMPGAFNELVYKNPDYYQKINMGISVWKIPKTIATVKFDQKKVEVMRGEALKIKPFCKNWEISFEHPDHPVTLHYVNTEFELDEFQQGAVSAIKNMRQGIVHGVTSAGKSLIILKAICELGQRGLVVVHRKILMNQLLEDIDKYIRDEKGNKITPGIVGNGKLTYGPITIAIDKTLAKNLSRYREGFGTVVLDECHLVSADTLSSTINGINSKYRFGFSGTLKRKDQKEFLIFSTFGQVIYTITKEQLIELGRIVPVRPVIWESETKFDWDSVVQGLTDKGDKNPTVKAKHLQEKTIAWDPGRNDMILSRIPDLQGKTIILSRYVEPCYALRDALSARFGLEAMVITGKDPKEAQESYLGMKKGDIKIIFATIGCVSTGVSISDLNNIVLISPLYTNELLLHQIRGRLMRSFKGKTHGTLYFVYDPYIFSKRKLNQFLATINN